MNTRFLVAITCVIALTLVACGGDSDSDSGGDGAAAGGSETTGDILFESDFAGVCNGVGVGAASGYSAGSTVTHMLAFVGEGNDYTNRSTVLNDAWRAPFDELDQVQVAVCLARTAEVEGVLCPGYEDDGVEWEVQTFGATYDVSVRDARTADEIETATFEVPPDDCPIFSSYQEGDPSPVPDYATPDGDLEVLLAPLASGAGGGGDEPAGDDDGTADDSIDSDPDDGDSAGGDAPGRDEAVEQLVDLGGYSEEEAECVVDGTIAEYGEFVLEPTDEQQAVLGQLLIDCAAEFGSTSGGDVDLGTGPDTPAPGLDAALDDLWNACAAGDAGSCDMLYLDAPVGSDYEQFGFTCGLRTEEVVNCSDILG